MAAALLSIVFSGPVLGSLYDFLMRLRPSPPISGEILIIDSTGTSIPGHTQADNILEPLLLSSVLYTLTELGAQTLIIQVPILGLSVGGSIGEDEILHRFNREFSILTGNIRNLFDGIRMGLIAPADSERYVRELVELSELSMDRLVSTLVYRDLEGILAMEDAAALFGQARRPGDLLVELIGTVEGGRPGTLAVSDEYSRAIPDRDGVIRRVAPVLSSDEHRFEHIVYSALKARLDDFEYIIPRDRQGSILFELPGRDRDFTRMGIGEFLAYDEADRNLRRLLLEAEALGMFDNVYGENRPGILHDFAIELRDEPLSSFQGGIEEKRALWIEIRNRYFESLEEFLYDRDNRYNPDDPGHEIEEDDLFIAIKAGYEELLGLRNALSSVLLASFCILGSGIDVEASALLANSLIFSRAINPGNTGILMIVSLISAFIISYAVKNKGLISTVFLGAFLCIIFCITLCISFIFTGFWLDPGIPAAAGGVGVIVSFAWALAARGRYRRNFYQSFGPSVSRANLRNIIRRGRPLPSDAITAKAVMIAVKQSPMPASKNLTNPTISLFEFQKKVSEIFKRAGGTIVGADGDIVLACFGSPLVQEKLDITGFTRKAAGLVSEIIRHKECAFWNFGIDTGSCVFTWSALSGYFAIGSAVQRAKLLSRLADRYKTRILLSAAIDEALPLDIETKKVDILKSRDGAKEEIIYSLSG
ncbi:MAG: hypothetical protein FWG77_03170 [Treponema sp.]|nr:hypothetical protein [Treponema sp.]